MLLQWAVYMMSRAELLRAAITKIKPEEKYSIRLLFPLFSSSFESSKSNHLTMPYFKKFMFSYGFSVLLIPRIDLSTTWRYNGKGDTTYNFILPRIAPRQTFHPGKSFVILLAFMHIKNSISVYLFLDSEPKLGKSIIKAWKYRSRELLKVVLFCHQKKR